MIILGFDIILFLSLMGMLVFTVRTKKKHTRYDLFTVIVLAFLNIGTTVLFTGMHHKNVPSNYTGEMLAAFCIGLVFAIPLIIITLLAILITVLQIKQNKTSSSYGEEFKITKFTLLKTLGFIILVLFAVYGAQYSVYRIQYNAELKAYNETRNTELAKMTTHLNEKYSLNLQPDDCVYYREEDYEIHRDFLGNGLRYNIPYIGIFESDGKKITVTDRKGFLSDNCQLDYLLQAIPRYFTKQSGLDIDYVQFEKAYLGSVHGDDNILNTVLQHSFNSLITEENLPEFMELVLQQTDLSISFYVKNSADKDTLIRRITDKLQYLKDYQNIVKVTVYCYDDTLVIDDTSLNSANNDAPLVINPGNEVRYEFGSYIVVPDKQILKYSASMILDRGYTPGNGETINGWVIRSY